jgi:predicted Zn-dependent protease
LQRRRQTILLLTLLAGLACPALQAEPRALPLKPLKSVELIRQGARLSTIRSFLELGRFYLAHNRLTRARSILVFGLLHDPSNPQLLSEAAQVELRLNNLQDAMMYAREALRLDPGPERAWTVQELERLLAARAATTATTGTTSTTASAPPTPSATATPAAAATTGPPGDELAVKVRALHLGRALEGAVKAYNTGRKKTEQMKTLDLEKLQSEHLLPEEFDLAAFPGTQLDKDGVLEVGGHGKVAALAAAVGEFEAGNNQISKHLHEGALEEAAFLLRDLTGKYPNESGLRERLIHTLRAQGRSAEALTLVERQMKASPGDTFAGYQHALLLFDTDRVTEALAEAETLAARPDSGLGGLLSRELARLAKHGLTRDLEAELQASASTTRHSPDSPQPAAGPTTATTAGGAE